MTTTDDDMWSPGPAPGTSWAHPGDRTDVAGVVRRPGQPDELLTLAEQRHRIGRADAILREGVHARWSAVAKLLGVVIHLSSCDVGSEQRIRADRAVVARSALAGTDPAPHAVSVWVQVAYAVWCTRCLPALPDPDERT